ncbi:hypothetical protein [Citrifermentans bremense]|uniref:hypothetical protein n=1 Tax=Citrifermentans bremense TaxID=60035 RepID=UPI000479DD08|nr:hypothetical protein [Citrifermentans bremense]
MTFSGRVLMVVGTLIVIYAMNMEVSLVGSNVVNMHLLGNRQMFVIIGSVVLISGVLIGYKEKSKNNVNVESGNNRIITICLQIYHSYNRAELLAATSFMIMLTSFLLPVKKYTLSIYDSYTYIRSDDIQVFMFFYIYPIVFMLVKRELNYKILAPISALSLVVSVCNLYDKYVNRYGYDDHMTVISISAGPWVSMMATVLYVASALVLFRQTRISQ